VPRSGRVQPAKGESERLGLLHDSVTLSRIRAAAPFARRPTRSPDATSTRSTPARTIHQAHLLAPDDPSPGLVGKQRPEEPSGLVAHQRDHVSNRPQRVGQVRSHDEGST
jgi:hypothetical protein